MTGTNTRKLTLALAALCSITLLSPQEASAQRRFGFKGANGSAGGFAQRFAGGGGAAGIAGRGKYGAGAAGAIATPYGGGGFHAGQFAGPNGGNFQSAGAGAYKPGVGAFRQGGFSGQGPNGGTASGNSGFKYNAQTGQGTQSTSAQFTNASGQTHGGSEQTTFTKGQGGDTSIQTDNHGDYNVDWQKGQKPVVTPTTTQ